MDVERGQAAGDRLIERLHHETRIAAIEIGALADLQPTPVLARYPRSKHRIEEQAAQRRQLEPALDGLCVGERTAQVAEVATKALRTKIIGNPRHGDLGDATLELHRVPCKIA